MKKAMRSLVAILLVLSILVSRQEPLLNAAADSALGPVYVADVLFELTASPFTYRASQLAATE